MSQVKNRKLCWNCDGSVHMHATKCPYCGAELGEEAPAAMSTTVPPPPYAMPLEQEIPQSAPPPPYQVRDAMHVMESKPVAEPESNMRDVILPMLLILPGAFFLLFSAILLLFAVDGVLTLQWNARYWLFYLVLAVPLLYFGWRSLRKGDPEGS